MRSTNRRRDHPQPLERLQALQWFYRFNCQSSLRTAGAKPVLETAFFKVRLRDAGRLAANSRSTRTLLIVDGLLAGFWRCDSRARVMHVRITPYASLAPRDESAVAEAVDAYGRFLEAPVERER